MTAADKADVTKQELEDTTRQLRSTKNELRFVVDAVERSLESNPPSPSSKRRKSWPRSPQTSPLGSPKKSRAGSNTSSGKAKSNSNAMDQKMASRVAKSWKAHAAKVKSSESKGLSRFGENFCYRTSLLQCLLHAPAFFQYLDDSHDESHHGEGQTKLNCLVCATRDLSTEYWQRKPTKSNSRSRLNKATSALNEVLSRIIDEDDIKYGELVDGSQNDPLVFLEFMSERFKQAEADGKLKLVLESIDPADWPELTLRDLFDIDIRREWTCEDCGHVSVAEPVQDEEGQGVGLLVDLQDPELDLSLVEYLQENVFEEKLDIRCVNGKCPERCKKGSKPASKARSRRNIVTKAPEILVLQLKRFAQRQQMKGKKGKPKFETFKITNQVTVDEYLNLAEFTDSEEPLIYRMDGVIAHQHAEGVSTINYGHYIAAVRDQSGERFCALDDDKPVTRDRRGAFRELWNPKSGKKKYDPYVLFYSKL